MANGFGKEPDNAGAEHSPRHEDVSGPPALPPEVGCRLIVEDPHASGQCRRCLYALGIYAFDIGSYELCPNCLKDRIEALVAEGVPLEGDLWFIYTSVCRDVEKQDAAFFGQLTVEMPEFERCARCDRLVQTGNAWYEVDPAEDAEDVSGPCCDNCMEDLGG
jgi:hypothetical protein